MNVANKQQTNEAQDRQLACKAAYEALTEEEHYAWNACRYTFRTLTNYDKLFVIWDIENGIPKIIGRIRTLELSLCSEGFNAQVSVEIGNSVAEMSVTHAPMPLFEDKVFCHIPFIVTAFYTPRPQTGKMVLRLPFVFKTQAKPWDKHSGVRVSQLKELREMFPEMEDLFV